MSVKKLEKKVQKLQGQREKHLDLLTGTETQLGEALIELAAARNSEGAPQIAGNRAKHKTKPAASKDE